MLDESKLYQYSNEELLEGYRETKSEKVLDAILSRFENETCRKSGETHDDVFARQFSSFVNGKMSSVEKTAAKLANDHRYLLSEKTKVCLAFLKRMAMNYHNKHIDPRNEYMCSIAAQAIDHIEQNTSYVFFPFREEGD